MFDNVSGNDKIDRYFQRIGEVRFSPNSFWISFY